MCRDFFSISTVSCSWASAFCFCFNCRLNSVISCYNECLLGMWVASLCLTHNRPILRIECVGGDLAIAVHRFPGADARVVVGKRHVQTCTLETLAPCKRAPPHFCNGIRLFFRFRRIFCPDRFFAGHTYNNSFRHQRQCALAVRTLGLPYNRNQAS